MNRSKIFLLLAVICLSCNQKNNEQHSRSTQQPVKTMATTIPSFDGTSAYSFLTAQTNFGPRNPSSIGHHECLNYLTKELENYADTVRLQHFTRQGYNETLRLTNIIASFKPETASRILLLAHWDTRPRAEQDPDAAKRNKPIIGANDGASGVAVLLELARILKNNPPPIGIDILLTDGEDYGFADQDGNDDMYFLGARYFAKTKPAGYNPRFGILLDMIGDADLQIPMEQFSMKYAPQIVDQIWNVADEIGIPQFVRVPGEAVSDDHIPLNEAGIPTIDLIDFQYPHWHTTHDTPDKCSPQSLEAVGKVLTTFIFTKLQE